jgi:hypothetical protein
VDRSAGRTDSAALYAPSDVELLTGVCGYFEPAGGGMRLDERHTVSITRRLGTSRYSLMRAGAFQAFVTDDIERF